MVIFTADHGHSLGDRNYMGKQGYPSDPSVCDVPLMIRFPKAEHADVTSDMFVQHNDITAAILETANVKPPEKIDGISFLDSAIAGKHGSRDHVTVGWSSTVTVITDKWWLNCKVDASGVLLYDLNSTQPFAGNMAKENPDVVDYLFGLAKKDAGGDFPRWIVQLAEQQIDAPGCSDLAARA